MILVNRAIVLSGVVILGSLTRSAGARGADNDAPQPLDDRARRGIVLVEQHGAPIALGTILGRDGRVLTALSGLAGANGADLRYADGSTVHAQLGRSDKASDLALLVPQSLAWTDGLEASDVDPDGAELRAILPSRGGGVGPAHADVRRDVAAHGQKGLPTVRMLDVSVKGSPMAGAPLLDAGGRVVAVIVHACKVIPTFPPGPATGDGEPLPLPPPPCVPEPMGAPVAAIRSFLAGTASPSTPWLGIRGEPQQGNVRGVRVIAVASPSPAQTAGLRPNADVIVAVDGRPVETPERLAEAVGRHGVADTVKVLVLSDQGYREVPVHLSSGPPAR
jgi:serine protease Do